MQTVVVLSLVLLLAFAAFIPLLPKPDLLPAIVLEAGFRPPSCLALSDTIVVGDFVMRLHIPSAFEVRAFNGPDATSFQIRRPLDSVELQSGEGVHWGSVESYLLWFEVDEPREISYAGSGLSRIVDISVNRRDGLRSRLVGGVFWSASYAAADAATSQIFDSILSTICFADPHRLENQRRLKGARPRCEYFVRPLGVEECVDSGAMRQ